MKTEYGNLCLSSMIKQEPVTVTIDLDLIGCAGLKELVIKSGDEKLVLTKEQILSVIRYLGSKALN